MVDESERKLQEREYGLTKMALKTWDKVVGMEG
jgi:hypothetical protein